MSSSKERLSKGNIEVSDKSHKGICVSLLELSFAKRVLFSLFSILIYHQCKQVLDVLLCNRLLVATYKISVQLKDDATSQKQ